MPLPSTEAARSVDTVPEENELTPFEKSSVTESGAAPEGVVETVRLLVAGSTAPPMNLSAGGLSGSVIDAPCSSVTATLHWPGVVALLVNATFQTCLVPRESKTAISATVTGSVAEDERLLVNPIRVVAAGGLVWWASTLTSPGWPAAFRTCSR